MKDNRFYFFQTKKRFEAKKDTVPYDAIVFIKKPAQIWTHDTYFSGGGGGSYAYDLSAAPIFWRTVTDRNATISTNISSYNQVTSLSSQSLSITLNEQFLHIVVPTTYNITSIRTSNNETLTVEDDFEKSSITVAGVSANVYKFVPVYPADYTIVFTFSNLPEE
jgi:hypothetical protein